MYIIIYTKYPSLVRSYKNIAKRQKSEVRSQISGAQGTGTCLNRATIVWLFSFIIRWENWDGRICWD